MDELGRKTIQFEPTRTREARTAVGLSRAARPNTRSTTLVLRDAARAASPSHSLNGRVGQKSCGRILDGWPSGLRRTIGNRVDIVRVGSNPTPSVLKESLKNVDERVTTTLPFEPTQTAKQDAA